MTDVVLLGLSVLSEMFLIFVVIMFYRLYRISRRYEFLHLLVGFLCWTPVSVAYALLAIFESSQFEEMHTFLVGVLFTFGVMIGHSMVVLSFHRLIEEEIPKRYILYFLFYTMVVPITFLTALSTVWTGDRWQIVYTPSFAVAVPAISLIILAVELGIDMWKIVRYSPNVKLKVMQTLMLISFLLTFPIFLLRDPLQLPINLWTIPILVYFSILGAAIYFYPKVFLTSSVTPLFLFIILSENGLPIKIYHFVDNQFVEAQDMLMAGALTAIQSVIQDASKQSRKLKHLKFEGIDLHVENNETTQFILASKKESHALKSLLISLKDELVVNSFSGNITEIEQKSDRLVRNTFQHQINRLELYIKEETRREIHQLTTQELT